MKTFAIKPASSVSLNELLRAELPRLIQTEISNSKIRRLIVAGSVSVNGRQVRVPSFAVYPKSSVMVQIDEEKLFFEKQPDDISFELSEKDVLFEDESIIVVNKPAHFPTESTMVESRDNLHAALVRFLFARQKIEKPNAKNPPYVGIMHRLDRDTSGVILFTKTRSVNAACHEMFENHTAKKVYLAVVCAKDGNGEKCAIGKEFTVEFPMGRISPKDQAAKWGKLSEKNGGVFSKTDFKVLSKISADGLNSFDFGNASCEATAILNEATVIPSEARNLFLVECRPLTGRTHQIRVHLASLGLPILGDTLYGGESYERIMLHAKSLSFVHPATGEGMKIEC